MISGCLKQHDPASPGAIPVVAPSPALRRDRTGAVPRGSRLFVAGIVLWTVWGLGCGRNTLTWPGVKAEIRHRFPTVAQLSIAEFAKAHADKAFVVDVRRPDEFAVSHLAGAVNLEDPDAIIKAFRRSNRSELVLYCSVGYRSSAVAAKIEGLLEAPVFNLEGSIFEWANSGRPVFRGKQRVYEVHPYDEKWGKLLNRQYHPLPRPPEQTP